MGESANADEFRRATDAYAVLSDPNLRASYDASGSVDIEEVERRRIEIYAAIAEVRMMSLAAQAEANRFARRGLYWFAGGAVITLASYGAAEPGESYSVFWGAMAFGAYKALRGFSHRQKVRKAASALGSIVI